MLVGSSLSTPSRMIVSTAPNAMASATNSRFVLAILLCLPITNVSLLVATEGTRITQPARGPLPHQAERQEAQREGRFGAVAAGHLVHQVPQCSLLSQRLHHRALRGGNAFARPVLTRSKSSPSTGLTQGCASTQNFGYRRRARRSEVTVTQSAEEETVTRATLGEYAALQRERYRSASRADKHRLLDEVVAVTGIHL